MQAGKRAIPVFPASRLLGLAAWLSHAVQRWRTEFYAQSPRYLLVVTGDLPTFAAKQPNSESHLGSFPAEVVDCQIKCIIQSYMYGHRHNLHVEFLSTRELVSGEQGI